jgi:predicted RNA-binding Zn ribbon-like protein
VLQYLEMTMKPVARIEGADWTDGFLFVGNELALDFLNTRPVLNGEATELLPDFAALVRWFRAAGRLDDHQAHELATNWAQTSAGKRAVREMRQWRERLRKQVIAREDGSSIQPALVKEVNHLMVEHPMRFRLSSQRKPSTELWFEPHRPEDLWAPLAHSVATLFAEADQDRVRKCGQCVLHFRDTSKKGTRRWCSMRLCGNRLKVAAYAARRR